MALFWSACSSDYFSSDNGDNANDQDSTLVSDVSWDEDFETDDEEPYYGNDDNSSSSSSPSSSSPSYNNTSNDNNRSSGGGGGVADNDEDVIKYQNYKRNSESPQEFANALLYPAIRMVYSDNFARPKAQILSSKKEGERHILKLRITWKDHWVSQYSMEGTLKVNPDGSDAEFVITDKNKKVEVLELTEDRTEQELRLPTL